MPETNATLDALSMVKQQLETSDEYWRIKSQTKVCLRYCCCRLCP